MRVLPFFHRFISVWALSGVGLLFLVVLLTNLDIFTTHFFSKPLTGIEDLLKLLVGSGMAMTLPYGELKKNHLRVDLLEKSLSPSFKNWLESLIRLGLVSFLGFLIYFTFLGMSQARKDGAISGILGVTHWYFYLPLLFSLLFWLLVVVTSNKASHDPSQ